MTTKLWEYHVERGPNPDLLNALGMQGWELVTVVTSSAGMDYTAFLKRPLVGEITMKSTNDSANTAASAALQ